MKSIELLRERGEEVNGPEDERTVVNLMIDQIEFANVILLNKVHSCYYLNSQRQSDLVSAEQLEKIRLFVAHINPSARIISTVNSQVDLKEILNTNLFDFIKAAEGGSKQYHN